MATFMDPEEEQAAIEANLVDRAQGAYWTAQAQPQDAQRIAALSQAYPWMPAGVNVALARDGHTPDSPIAQAAGRATATQKLDDDGDDFWKPAKAVTRYGTAALAAPLEEITGVARNISTYGPGGRALAGAGAGAATGAIVGSVVPVIGTAIGAAVGAVGGGILGLFAKDPEGEANWQSQSTLGVALTQDKDLGQGWFAAGEAAQERIRRNRTVQVGGHAWTPGRMLASSVTEPGSGAYNVMSGIVDFSTVLKGDPAGAALGGLSKARKARQLFVAPQSRNLIVKADQAARGLQPGVLNPLAGDVQDFITDPGLVDGLRKTVLPEQVWKWFGSKQGQAAVNKIAETKDFNAIWLGSNKKIPVQLARELADAETPADVMNLLGPKLGTEIRAKFNVRTKPRLAQDLVTRVAEDGFDLQNADEAVTQMDATLRSLGAKAKIPEHQISALNRAMAEATSLSDPEARYQAGLEVARMASKTMFTRIVVAAPKGFAKDPDKLAAWEEMADKVTRFWKNSTQRTRLYNVDEIGNNVVTPGGVIDANPLNLPSPHLLSEKLHSTIPGLDSRELGRMSGHFNRVTSSGAWHLATDTILGSYMNLWRVTKIGRAATGLRVLFDNQARMTAESPGTSTLFRNPLDFYSWVFGRKGGSILDAELPKFDPTDLVRRKKYQEHIVTDVDEFKGLMSDHSKLWLDRKGAARRSFSEDALYGKADPEFVGAWGNELTALAKDQIAPKVAAMGPEKAAEWLIGPGSNFLKRIAMTDETITLDYDGALKYASTVEARIRVKTQAIPELRDFVATGKLNGETGIELGKHTRTVSRFLSAQKDELPDTMKFVGDRFVDDATMRQIPFGEAYKAATDFMFDHILTMPDNILTRSAEFRQLYWRRAEELLPFTDAATKAKVMETARKSNLGADQLAKLDAIAPQGNLNADDFSLFAKGYAADETRKLVDDMVHNQQWMDASRIIMPFGKAWKSSMANWVKLLATEPRIVRRFQQGVEGARGSGFFFTDETTGEEMFAYPGSEWIGRALFDMPSPMVGRAQGLALAGEILPGFGPVVQLPASEILADKPGWEMAKRLLIPHGPKGIKDIDDDLLPTWFRSIKESWDKDESNRSFANTAYEVARYRVMNGQAPKPQTQEQLNQLIEESTDRARGLMIVRGLAAAVLPSAPSYEFWAKDASKGAEPLVAMKLVEDFRKLQDEDYDTAVGKFIDKHGEQAYLYMQPNSKALAYSSPVTKEGAEWVRAHKEFASLYPSINGFFAPKGGEFDIEAYSMEFETGAREALTLDQKVALANHRLAEHIYAKEKEAGGPKPSKEYRDYLSDLSAALKTEYPGWREMAGIPAKVSNETAIAEIITAAAHPDVADTALSQAIRLYAQKREEAYASITTKTLTAKDAKEARDWLEQIGLDLAAEVPDFAPVYDQLFARELD